MAGNSRHPVVRRGDLLAGRYKVERVLGQGGMGLVVAAKHRELGQRVAVKLMLPRAAQADDARQRFLREARAAVRLRSEHVARVIDVGTLERAGEDSAPYIVMEYLEGEDLAQLLRRRGALDVEDAVAHVLQACEAVGEAHAVGIVHRDLKPANLFLSRAADGSPRVKVLDFGISKLSSDEQLDRAITKTDGAMGTPHYMAPEQMRSAKNVDERADIWSLGVILYELISGKVPYEADGLTGLIAAVLETDPDPVSSHAVDIDEELASVIMRCLEKRPEDRWASVAELAAALAPHGPPEAQAYAARVVRVMESAVSSRAPQPGPGEDDAQSPSTLTNSAWRAEPATDDGGNAKLLLLSAFAVVVAVVAGFYAGRTDDRPQATAPSAPVASPAQPELSTSSVGPMATNAPSSATPLLQAPSARTPSPPSTSTTASPQPRPPAVPKARVPAHVVASPAAKPSSTPKAPTRRADCDAVPLYEDDEGIWRPRPECNR